MDIYFAEDLARELDVPEHKLWRAYAAATTPEASIRRERRREAAVPDGALVYMPVSIYGASRHEVISWRLRKTVRPCPDFF
jgi:hypothetical protein